VVLWGRFIPGTEGHYFPRNSSRHHQNGNFVGKALTGKTHTTEILVHDFADKDTSDTQQIQTGKSWAVQNFTNTSA
jgi:hypothetical protein